MKHVPLISLFLWSSLCPSQGKNFSSSLILLWFRTLWANVTLFTTIVTSHNLLLTISGNMTHFFTLEALLLVQFALIPTVPDLTTVIAPDKSNGVSPTRLIPTTSLGITSTIWLTLIYRILPFFVN